MVTATVQGAHTARALKISQTRVARSEWIKLRSLRSTGWTLAVSAVLTVGTGAVLCAVSAAHLHAGKPASIDPVRLGLFGIYLAQLAVGLLGVLAATGEYATGTIRTTLTAVPRRMPVLWAKIGIVAAVVVVTSQVMLFVTFVACQAILSAKHASVSLADPGVLQAVAGSGLYLAGVSVLGVAIGFVLRSTAAAAGVMFGVVLVLPEVLGAALPASLAPDILPYLPSNAGQAIMETGRVADTMAPWTGMALFAAYVVVVVVTAALVLRRRDA